MSKGSLSRRRFLKTSALVAGAVAAGNARGASPNDRIRFAAIGCRNQGGNDARQFLRSGEFDLAALCDCDEAMFQNALGRIKGDTDTKPTLVKDFRNILDDKSIDAVIIAVPDHWHGLMTALALDAGKHVYVEKPASYNIQDGKLMVEAQKKRPELIVHVGTQQRSGAHFSEAKQFIDEGGLGAVGFCRGWITHNREVLPDVPDTAPPETMDYEMWVGPAPFQPYNPQKVHYNWHWQREYGTGEMGNWGAHWLDVCRWFAGVDYPTGASGHGGQFVVNDIKEWPDTQTIVYEFPKLTMLWEQRIWTRHGVNDRGSGAEIAGNKGSIVIDRSGWTFYPTDGEPEQHSGSELDVAHARSFAEAIRAGKPSNTPIEEGFKSAVLCHLGNIVAAIGRPVRFDAETQHIVQDDEAQTLESREYRAPWKAPV